MPKLEGLPSTFGARSKLKSTSSAVNGVPSWNFTSRRSLNSQVVSSIAFHDSARLGRSRWRSSWSTRYSKMWLSNELLGVRLWKCGSIEVGSAATPRRRSWPYAAMAYASSAAPMMQRMDVMLPPPGMVRPLWRKISMKYPTGMRPPAVPLVLDSPHSGREFPADFDAAVSEAELREGEDCYVDELYAAAHELGAPLLAASFPRTYIDPNRHAGDVDLEMIDGPWPWEYRPSGKARIVKALLWRTLEDGQPIYRSRLRAVQVRQRIDRCHAPYHSTLKAMMEDAWNIFGKVYHLNCHSMRAVAGRQSDDGEGSVRADFVLGDRDGTTCDPRLTEYVRETLASMGYSVK